MSASSERSQAKAATAGVRLRAPVLNLEALAARPGLLAGAALALLVAIVAVVQAPVLGHYFFADDFFPLADAESRSNWGYIRDLFLLRDLTPNWRFLTGLVYLTEYRAFGLHAVPYLVSSVVLHTATAALLFAFVRRVTGNVWTAFLAGAFFGVTAAPVPAVGHITAFTHVLAAFFFMLTLLTLYEGLEREHGLPWYVASVVCYTLTIGANESFAVLAPVPALLALWKLPQGNRWWYEPKAWAQIAAVAAPYAVVSATTLLALGACRCTQADDLLGGGEHVWWNLWIYLGRLLYPVGMEYPGRAGTAHLVAGCVLGTIAVAALVRGPAFVRITVVFLILALLPYLPINWALAPRYVYMATIPFAILAAIAFTEAARLGAKLSPLVPAALAVVAFGVLGVYAWQTWEQDREFGALTENWRTLATSLERQYGDVPAGSTLVVRGGPLNNILWQTTVLGSLSEVVYGDGTRVYTTAEGAAEFCIPRGELYIVDYDGGRLTLAAQAGAGGTAAPGVTMVSCRAGAPLPWPAELPPELLP